MNIDRTFFSELIAIEQISGLSDLDRYVDAPSDWYVVVSDIRDSTVAVDKGKYKEVNMSAGCIITAILNTVNKIDLPFVFGGDGATLLVPPYAVDAVKIALIRTRTLIRNEFSLEMRIGLVPIKDVLDRGAELRVARLELSPGNSVALFDGGGIELAEVLVRKDTEENRFSIPSEEADEPPDLTGLSCRWEPLESRNGAMLCLIVRPTANTISQRAHSIKKVMDEVSRILGGGLVNNRPVTSKNMRFRWPPRGLIAEVRATRGKRFFLVRYAEVLFGSLIQLVLERFDLKGGNYDAPAYREELRNNSDYCRFHDVLNVVLDCTMDQIDSIESYLEKLHNEGEVQYGSFTTKQALMTCLLDDLESSQHLHFIDGDDGGFWAASKKMKLQEKTDKASII